MTTGFNETPQGIWIAKDPQANLTYTLDWNQWLLAGDSIAQVEFTVAARVNDPQPLVKISEGIVDGTKTYIQLSAGQVNKVYIVTAKVTTADGLVDRRSFRVHVENRVA